VSDILVRRKASERHRDLEAVLVHPFDVVWGIALFASPLDLVENVKKAVESNGRPPEWSPIITYPSPPESKMGTSRLRTPSGARLTSRDPEGVPVTAGATPKKI
jgi:hypothetical protein